jgi:hypothetical protein
MKGNLQVPAYPNYSLIFYFGADRPIQEGSLLDMFVNGSDAFRDSRFKLIPRIVEVSLKSMLDARMSI